MAALKRVPKPDARPIATPSCSPRQCIGRVVRCNAVTAQHDSAQMPSQPASHVRRHMLMAAAAAAVALGDISFCSTPAALADSRPLPKAYKELVLTMCKSLREAIEAEQAGQSEAEVRRKADPAKDALMQFVRRWRGDPIAKNHPSHKQVMAILSELGGFYQKNGPRARLPDDMKLRVLGYISEAEAALEAPKPELVPPAPVPAPSLRGGGSAEEELRELLPANV